jgi:hypothetical protein
MGWLSRLGRRRATPERAQGVSDPTARLRAIETAVRTAQQVVQESLIPGGPSVQSAVAHVRLLFGIRALRAAIEAAPDRGFVFQARGVLSVLRQQGHDDLHTFAELARALQLTPARQSLFR